MLFDRFVDGALELFEFIDGSEANTSHDVGFRLLTFLGELQEEQVYRAVALGDDDRGIYSDGRYLMIQFQFHIAQYTLKWPIIRHLSV
jgi:hypothetical protein